MASSMHIPCGENMGRYCEATRRHLATMFLRDGRSNASLASSSTKSKGRTRSDDDGEPEEDEDMAMDEDEEDDENIDEEQAANRQLSRSLGGKGQTRGTVLITLRDKPPYTLWYVLPSPPHGFRRADTNRGMG